MNPRGYYLLFRSGTLYTFDLCLMLTSINRPVVGQFSSKTAKKANFNLDGWSRCRQKSSLQFPPIKTQIARLLFYFFTIFCHTGKVCRYVRRNNLMVTENGYGN